MQKPKGPKHVIRRNPAYNNRFSPTGIIGIRSARSSTLKFIVSVTRLLHFPALTQPLSYFFLRLVSHCLERKYPAFLPFARRKIWQCAPFSSAEGNYLPPPPSRPLAVSLHSPPPPPTSTSKRAHSIFLSALLEVVPSSVMSTESLHYDGSGELVGTKVIAFILNGEEVCVLK
jgi:hypothetical protein